MRVTTKGQVTIPKKIREKLNITPLSQVRFVEGEDDRIYIEKVKSDENKESRFSKLRGAATVKMTTEEIMKLTRGSE